MPTKKTDDVKYIVLTDIARLQNAENVLLGLESEHYRTKLAAVDPNRDERLADLATQIADLQPEVEALRKSTAD